MKYLKNIKTGEIFGFDENQKYLIDQAINDGFLDISDAWPPVIEMTYQQKRIAEYPNFLDYLDGIVKNDDAQVKAYIDACLAIKAKYPKA